MSTLVTFCLCRDWTFLWVTSPQNRMSVTAVTLNNKHLLPGNPNAQSGPTRKQARNQLATYSFSLLLFFSNWPLLRPGWSGGWAALHGNCARHCHDNPFYGAKKENKRKGNTIELIGVRVDDRTHEMLPPLSLRESLCVSLNPSLRHSEVI